MDYFEVWQRIRDMKAWQRKQVAYELRLMGCNVGDIFPYRYPQQKSARFLEFFAPGEKKWEDDKYYKELKQLLENDSVIHICVKRSHWLPRFINDWREGRIIKSFIKARIGDKHLNCYYRIMPGKELNGERPCLLQLRNGNGGEVVYKMTACNYKDGYEQMTSSKMEK